MSEQLPSSYSASKLCDLLIVAEADSIHLALGHPPVLVKQGKKLESQGPDLTDSVFDEILRSVATNRQIRELRARGTADFFHTHKRHRFLIRATQAFDDFRLELSSL